MPDQPDWTITLDVGEAGGSTRAQVRLGTAGGARYEGIGVVAAPAHADAAELAVVRALSDLIEEILEAVASDIESQAE
ncbi:dsRBD fold-containing protein [Amycolatopsis sp.]|uniref:dsRBD fold-containing protein n=1 Tax=Amycolatopsis sp. TaxID=37632 RepID=UPI002C64275A|nr:dsRBD fold-containing protein [Amycolatopsis sp.]HVV13467.1 dsRBD fold-containing protein [Amycolatopsis sp.]